MYIQQSKEENPTARKQKLQQDSGVSSTNLVIYNEQNAYKPLFQGSISSLACYCKDLLLQTFFLPALAQLIVFIWTQNWVSLLQPWTCE